MEAQGRVGRMFLGVNQGWFAGPGVTNALTAIKNAQLAQSPLVLLGGATGLSVIAETASLVALLVVAYEAGGPALLAGFSILFCAMILDRIVQGQRK